MGLDVAAQRAAFARQCEEPRLVDRDLVVQPGHHGDRGFLQVRAFGVGGVVQPVPLVRVGHDVRRYAALDPLHDEEGRAERAGVLFQPQDARHRQVGVLGDEPHRAVLARHVVDGKDGVRGRVGRQAQRAEPQGRFRVLDGEEQGLAGHAVGLRDAHVDRLGAGQPGVEPRGEAAGEFFRVAGGGAGAGCRCHGPCSFARAPLPVLLCRAPSADCRRSQGATEPKPVNPLGSWRPKLPCSKMPWPVRPFRVKRAAWSMTPYAASGWALGSERS